jgi:hypothetical protein
MKGAPERSTTDVREMFETYDHLVLPTTPDRGPAATALIIRDQPSGMFSAADR